MLYELPPAGNSIPAKPAVAGAVVEEAFGAAEVAWVSSGAAALALALQVVLAADSERRRRVLIPAYTCPEVIAAVHYAGAEPVLVDLAPETPWLDLDAVASRVGDGVAAVVAVDLFGIPERLADLRALCRPHGVVLVEDSAQRFPTGLDEGWSGDLVVLSFGRGKPVSTLGGGALLARGAALQEQLRTLRRALPEGGASGWKLKVKIHLYNLLRRPELYWIPTHFPGLGLGQTVYHPLVPLESMSAAHRALLPAALARYRQGRAENEAFLHRALDESRTVAGLVDLPGRVFAGKIPRLSRYPILVSAAARDRIHAELSRRGLGASLMYRATLPHIAGLEERLKGSRSFPGAEDFSRRLITLPVHDGVGRFDIERIVATLRGATQG